MSEINLFQDLREEEKAGNGWTYQALTMNKRIPQPSLCVVCCLLAICTVLQFITIIVIASNARQGADRMEQSLEAKFQNLSLRIHSREEQLSADSRMMETLKALNASVKEIKDSDVMAKVVNVQSSVDRILSDDVLGSFSSEFQRILIAISKLREEASKGNGTEGQLCSEGWTHFGLSCYYRSAYLRTWKSAQNDCVAQSAHLVVVNGADEMTFIMKFSEQKTTWIGLTDVDGEWKWVDGTSYDITPKFWLDGQPDDWFGHGRGGGEDCGQLKLGNAWNDDHCTRYFPYICEKKLQ